jgi:hypothetical protein
MIHNHFQWHLAHQTTLAWADTGGQWWSMHNEHSSHQQNQEPQGHQWRTPEVKQWQHPTINQNKFAI